MAALRPERGLRLSDGWITHRGFRFLTTVGQSNARVVAFVATRSRAVPNWRGFQLITNALQGVPRERSAPIVWSNY